LNADKSFDNRAAKPTQRRSAETAKKFKKHRNRQKSNIAKHQNKIGMEKAYWKKYK
jgi:hypothetical protein